MIIQCDKCGTKFELADDKIGEKGARVRCSKCKSVFTVKKPASQQEQQAPSPPPPPEQKEKPKAPSSSPPAEEDPFSDFSFNDDLDFSEGEDDVQMNDEHAGQSVPPPPEAGGEDMMDDAPSVSFDKPPPPQEEPSIGDDFDFPDTDIDFSDESETTGSPEPANVPPPPAKGAGDFADKGAGESFDDFGDISFDEESFTGAPAGAASAGGAGGGGGENPDVEEYGNVSLSDMEEGADKPQGFEDFDDMNSDFQFDSGAEDEGMEMDVDDFVRSSKSRAPVSDDYEASIGEPETEAEAPKRPVPEEKEPPPPPPKPAVSKRAVKESHGLRNLIIVLIILLLAIGGGGFAFTNSKGWFTVEHLKNGEFGKLAKVPHKFMVYYDLKTVPLDGEPRIIEESLEYQEKVQLKDESYATVIWGEVINDTNKDMDFISVKIPVIDPQTEEVLTEKWGYCGKNYSADYLENYDNIAIELKMHEKPAEVPAGGICKFTLLVPNNIESVKSEFTIPLHKIAVRGYDYPGSEKSVDNP